MAVDPLDNSSDRFLTFTMNEIKILVGMMTKLKELFPIEGHYYVHKVILATYLITICKQQLSTRRCRRTKGEIRDMTKHFIDKAIENMEWYGGSFVQSLAVCYRKADPDNKTIIYNAFEHLFFKYAKFKND